LSQKENFKAFLWFWLLSNFEAGSYHIMICFAGCHHCLELAVNLFFGPEMNILAMSQNSKF